MKLIKVIAGVIAAGLLTILASASSAYAQPPGNSPLFDRDVQSISRMIFWFSELNDGDALRTEYRYDDNNNVDKLLVFFKNTIEPPLKYDLVQSDGNGRILVSEFALAEQCGVQLVLEQLPAGGVKARDSYCEDKPSDKPKQLYGAIYALYELAQ
jgi:hypothetical protein